MSDLEQTARGTLAYNRLTGARADPLIGPVRFRSGSKSFPGDSRASKIGNRRSRVVAQDRGYAPDPQAQPGRLREPRGRIGNGGLALGKGSCRTHGRNLHTIGQFGRRTVMLVLLEAGRPSAVGCDPSAA